MLSHKRFRDNNYETFIFLNIYSGVMPCDVISWDLQYKLYLSFSFAKDYDHEGAVPQLLHFCDV